MTTPLKFPLMEKPTPAPRSCFPKVSFETGADGKVLFRFITAKWGNSYDEDGDVYVREVREKDAEEYPEAWAAFQEASAAGRKAKR